MFFFLVGKLDFSGIALFLSFLCCFLEGSVSSHVKNTGERYVRWGIVMERKGDIN